MNAFYYPLEGRIHLKFAGSKRERISENLSGCTETRQSDEPFIKTLVMYVRGNPEFEMSFVLRQISPEINNVGIEFSVKGILPLPDCLSGKRNPVSDFRGSLKLLYVN